MNMFFSSGGSPLISLLIGLVILAGVAVLFTVMLPVALVLLLAIIFIGVLNSIWYKVTGKALFGDVMQKYQSKWQSYREGMGTTYQETYETYARTNTAKKSNTKTGVLRITTSDNKKWKMQDVEDIETKDK